MGLNNLNLAKNPKIVLIVDKSNKFKNNGKGAGNISKYISWKKLKFSKNIFTCHLLSVILRRSLRTSRMRL